MKEKSLAKNSLSFILYKLMSALFPLVTVSYVSQVILASGVGKVSSAQNIVQYFVLIASLGIPNYGIREIAKVKNNNIKVSKLFSELFMINTVSTIVCIILYYLMIQTMDTFESEQLLYYVMGLTIVLNIFNVDWFYQGIEEYTYITKRSFIIKFVSILLLFVLVRDRNDYIFYAIVYILGIAGNNLVNFINLKKNKISISLSNCNIQKHFKSIFVLLCTTIAIELYTMVDTTMLTFICNNENVAYYNNSIKIVRLVIMLVTAIGAVLLPRLSYYNSIGKRKECEDIVNKVFQIIFFLLVPCGIGIYMLADAIVLILFGSTFYSAIITLKIASILIYALGFSNLFGTQILLTFGEEKKLFIATLIGAVTNILLNSVLILRFEQNGAVVASIISEFIVTCITFYFARKYLKIFLSIKFVFKTLFSSVVMIGIICIIRYYITSYMWVLILGILGGAMSYLGMSMVVKNEVVVELKNLIIKKLGKEG